MSARKVSRIAGLVFVLAAIVGGVAATTSTGDVSTHSDVTAADVIHFELIWS
jgi:hypothetical protein